MGATAAALFVPIWGPWSAAVLLVPAAIAAVNLHLGSQADPGCLSSPSCAF